MYQPKQDRYTSGMRYNRAGRSGVKLSAVSLGLWHNFGYVDVYENMKNMLFKAFDLGITHFDTGNNYGPPPGSAEANLGRVLREELKAHRDELIIGAKAGYTMWDGPYGDFGSKKYLLASLDQSLTRLGLDYVDIFYHHRPDPDTPIEESMEALAHALTSGKALYVALSNYTPEQTKAACAALKTWNYKPLLHQPKYNMFERTIEHGLLDVLQDEGMGCVVFSPLAQGRLSDRYLNGVPADSRAARAGDGVHYSFLNKDLVQKESAKCMALNQIAQSRGQSLAQLALSWSLRDERVTSVIIGAGKPEQIEENAKCVVNWTFSESELNDIDAILATIN